VWRKADNWTAFTDGYRTWVNGPAGLVRRLNTERFPWEGDAGAPGTTLLGTSPVPRPTPAPTRQTDEQFFTTLAARYATIGGVPFHLQVERNEYAPWPLLDFNIGDQDNEVLTLTESIAFLSLPRTALQGWMQRALADLRTRWPGQRVTIYVKTQRYFTNYPCWDSDWTYLGDYRLSKSGWYTVDRLLKASSDPQLGEDIKFRPGC
jgi:hypothetical protein